MTAKDAQQVRSCGELSVGDEIEAWHNGRLFHRGEVLRTVPATDLFWIRDGRTGTRRLIDAEVLVILRVAAPAVIDGAVAVEGSATATATATATAAAGGTARMPAPGRAAARVPASHIPLFQAPTPVS
jgi:hypothetical protein